MHNTKKQIIGVVGFIGSGKDTVADYFVNNRNFARESFANTLKDIVSITFGWDRTMIEGKTPESRAWREQVDPWWANRLSMPQLTPRWVLQYWGTDILRNYFHDNIWIASLENKLRTSKHNVIISDCRFPNEINSIKNAGGKIIQVNRGTIPEWYDIAVEANTTNLTDMVAKTKLATYNIHISETAWVGTIPDIKIENNGSINDLYEKLSLI